ncbi:hypothetical protein DWY22_10795 [Heyndrickxia coagulans]|nr:hypothetical protein DWY22_10795 [Heyndrickxia coagulans]RGR96502.1 hypothetical protein DWY16_11640 [Heyndrickxia coagulans]
MGDCHDNACHPPDHAAGHLRGVQARFYLPILFRNLCKSVYLVFESLYRPAFFTADLQAGRGKTGCGLNFFPDWHSHFPALEFFQSPILPVPEMVRVYHGAARQPA